MTGAEVMVEANGALYPAEHERRAVEAERDLRLHPPPTTVLGEAVRTMLGLPPDAPGIRVVERLRVVIEAAMCVDGPGVEFRRPEQEDTRAGASSLPADEEAEQRKARAALRTQYDLDWKGPRNCQGRPAPPMRRGGGYTCPCCFADCRTETPSA